MLRLYRVFPWIPSARPGEPGHPLFITPTQGSSRIDNPRHYRAMYAMDHPAGAVGEAFGRRLLWSDEMLISTRLPEARRAIVELQADVTVIDLDDGATLASQQLKPSMVASPDRKSTRAWALRIFQTREFDGVRWWSVRDSRWGALGLWRTERVEAGDPSILDRGHPAMAEAASAMRRVWID